MQIKTVARRKHKARQTKQTHQQEKNGKGHGTGRWGEVVVQVGNLGASNVKIPVTAMESERRKPILALTYALAQFPVPQ